MKADVVIVGGGPGGTSSSLFLQKYGIRSVIVEKEQFPGYHIGEAMTGRCGAVVRALGMEAQFAADSVARYFEGVDRDQPDPFLVHKYTEPDA